MKQCCEGRIVRKGGLYTAEDVIIAQSVLSGLVSLAFRTQSSQPHGLIGLVFPGLTHGSALVLV